MSEKTDGTTVQRRTFLAGTGVVVGTALAGCSSGEGDTTDTETTAGDGGSSSGGTHSIAVGPGGSLVFEPTEVTISTGETVTWEFESPGHNVCAWPRMHDEVSIPAGASGFGTMEKGGDKYETVAARETFTHTFETPGEYTYVCVPHVAAGMVGTVIVE